MEILNNLKYKLQDKYQIKLDEDVELMDLANLLDKEDIPYYYVSYNDEDIVNTAKDECIDDVEVYEFKGGFIGFQEGVLW